jgi:hypothetical protein
MPITPGQAFLSLPAGLTEADYPVADNLLDFSPTTVEWNPPLAPTGENIYANYVKAYPDLLKAYNRRLATPSGRPGSLPLNKYGAPISMAEYGYGHWGDIGKPEGRVLATPPARWGDPGRSPYLPYFYPGESVEIEEGFSDEQIEEARALNAASIAAGGSQVITGDTGSVNLSDLLTGDNGDDPGDDSGDDDPGDDPTEQEKFKKKVEEEAAETAYPFGHTTFAGWNMDDRNPFGHWWSLQNASAWTDPDTGQRHVQGPKSWTGSMWV